MLGRRVRGVKRPLGRSQRSADGAPRDAGRRPGRAAVSDKAARQRRNQRAAARVVGVLAEHLEPSRESTTHACGTRPVPVASASHRTGRRDALWRRADSQGPTRRARARPRTIARRFTVCTATASRRVGECQRHRCGRTDRARRRRQESTRNFAPALDRQRQPPRATRARRALERGTSRQGWKIRLVEAPARSCSTSASAPACAKRSADGFSMMPCQVVRARPVSISANDATRSVRDVARCDELVATESR